MALRHDLDATRAAAMFLRAELPPAGDAGVALVAEYRDELFETKLDLVLAAALRLRGVEPVLSIPSRRAHRVARYARAVGVHRVIAQDTLTLTRAERAECTDAGAALLAAPADFGRVVRWTFRGYAIGTHVLSTLIRTTFDGAPDPGDPATRTRIAAILHDVLVNVVRAERLLRMLAPRMVLVEEANYSANGPLVDVAVHRGVDVVQTVPIWRDDAIMSKRITSSTRRVDAKSVSTDTLTRVAREVSPAERDAALEDDFAARYPPTARANGPLPAALRLDPERRTVVVFCHVLWDASLFYGRDLFENYTDWLVHTVRAAVENPCVNWVVKTHPSTVSVASRGRMIEEGSELALIRARFPRLPDHVQVLAPDSPISAYTLYEHADYGVTVRGTPGVEMSCFGKPAFTAGTGTYAGFGFTHDSSTAGEYLERLATIHHVGPLPPAMVDRARWYAYALFIRRPWVPRAFSLTYDGARPQQLRRSLTLTSRSLDELRAPGDLDAWARWALDADTEDHLPDLRHTVHDRTAQSRTAQKR